MARRRLWRLVRGAAQTWLSRTREAQAARQREQSIVGALKRVHVGIRPPRPRPLPRSPPVPQASARCAFPVLPRPDVQHFKVLGAELGLYRALKCSWVRGPGERRGARTSWERRSRGWMLRQLWGRPWHSVSPPRHAWCGSWSSCCRPPPPRTRPRSGCAPNWHSAGKITPPSLHTFTSWACRRAFGNIRRCCTRARVGLQGGSCGFVQGAAVL